MNNRKFFRSKRREHLRAFFSHSLLIIVFLEQFPFFFFVENTIEISFQDGVKRQKKLVKTLNQKNQRTEKCRLHLTTDGRSNKKKAEITTEKIATDK